MDMEMKSSIEKKFLAQGESIIDKKLKQLDALDR